LATRPTTPEAFQVYLTRLSRPSTEGRLVCVRDSGAMAVGRDHERWAITVEMTETPMVDPHPTLPAR
jgi:hypothetical protein